LFEVLARDDYSSVLISMTGSYAVAASPDSMREKEDELAKELGEERMSHLRAYLYATPGRLLVEQIEEQLVGRDLPLSVAQRQQLLRGVVREHEHFKAPGATPYGQTSWAETAAQRLTVLDHLQAIGQPILSPDQLQAVIDLRDVSGIIATN
jgi:hypothetical protein